jgi:nitrogen fixation/metabolism regulation signal transduction histidine kinase
MKKSDLLENVILLLSAILLLPIWLVQSKQSQSSEALFVLQGVLVVVLVVILVRRVRRIVAAMRQNKNRRGPFPF